MRVVERGAIPSARKSLGGVLGAAAGPGRRGVPPVERSIFVQ